MKITRRQLIRLIKEAMIKPSIQGLSDDHYHKVDALASSGDEVSQAQARELGHALGYDGDFSKDMQLYKQDLVKLIQDPANGFTQNQLAKKVDRFLKAGPRLEGMDSEDYYFTLFEDKKSKGVSMEDILDGYTRAIKSGLFNQSKRSGFDRAAVLNRFAREKGELYGYQDPNQIVEDYITPRIENLILAHPIGKLLKLIYED